MLKLLFTPQSALYSAAASLTQPIFDGYRLLGQLDFQKARRTELLELYRKAILSGFADVERALIAIRDLAEQERLQTEAVATARRAYELSETQLRAGTVDITTVLNTQRTLFTEQDQLVVVRLTRMQAIVSLFQALGGGWVIPDEIAAEGGRPRSVPSGNESERLPLMNLRRILPIAVGTAVVVAVGAYVVLGEQAKQEQKSRRSKQFQDQAAPVLVARATTADVPIYLDAVGNVRALNTVTVRAQVGGQIVRIAFLEGQDVKRGDVLAEIDPRTYQAQFDQAVAKKAQDEATLANARIDLDRYAQAGRDELRIEAAGRHAKSAGRPARGTGAGRSGRDRQCPHDAELHQDHGARIDGRTGIRLIDEGNLVQAGDTTGIVVITQLKPIAVLFNLPQQQFQQVNKAFTAGPVTVEALGADGRP